MLRLGNSSAAIRRMPPCSSKRIQHMMSAIGASHSCIMHLKTLGVTITCVQPHLRCFTISCGGVETEHRFAILSIIPYESERARVNFYVVRCGVDKQVRVRACEAVVCIEVCVRHGHALAESFGSAHRAAAAVHQGISQ